MSTSVTDDPRMGDIIKRVETDSNYKASSKLHLGLLGFPYDEGVRRNGGRVGSKDGPIVLRKLMQRIGTVVNVEYNADLRQIEMLDFGDIDGSLSLEEGHKKLRETVGSLIKNGVIPFVVGGGNDQSFPNGSALLDNYSDVGVINIDAHFDVRPLKNGLTHSGSPFRQLLEDRLKGSRFVEFASQGNQCSAIHAEYIKEKGGSIHWLSSLRKNGNIPQQFEEIINSLGENVFVSFDLDAVCGRDAPGVSAPGTIGLSSEEALEMCFIAGKHKNVKLFDLSEYNPAIEDYRTGRLVANMFYFFAMGLSLRN